MLKKISAFLILITWPLSMYAANTFPNFIHYLIPPIISLICYFLWRAKYKYFFLPIFILPFIEPKFSILPFLFLIIYFNRNILKLKNIILIGISLLLIVFTFRGFIGQTIFTYDNNAIQQNLQKSNLYNSVLLARIFQNKLRIPIDKFSTNFFQITDPNNYFFGNAPRQIIVNDQNTINFPFLSIPFVLIGLFFIRKHEGFLIILSLALSEIINLSLLNIYDRDDFIIWTPLFLIALYGLNLFDKKFETTKFHSIYYLIFIIFSSIELLRILSLKTW